MALVVISAGFASAQTKNTLDSTEDVRGCGVVGNKVTDDTVAIQSCINALPDYHILFFPAGLKMKITGTIKLHGRYGIELIGLTSVFQGPSAGTDAPTFYWYGADAGTMMDINDCDSCSVRGLAFFSAPNYGNGAGGANTGINVDQTLNLGVTETNNIFERDSIIGSLQNPNFRGIVFAGVGGSNVEKMTVRDSVVSCSYVRDYTTAVGQGIVIGGSYNAKKHLYTNNAISYCGTGIWIANGSADVVHNEFSENNTDVFANPIDPVRIDDNDSENTMQFFRGAMSFGSSISNNRIAAVHPPAGVGAVQFTGGVTAPRFEGNSFDQGSYTAVSGQGAPYGAPFMISRGNKYPDSVNTLAGFLTFGYGLLSEFDFFGGFTSTYMEKGVPNLPNATPGFGQFFYDYASQSWRISENGGPFIPLLTPIGTPANSSTICEPKQIEYDANYVYFCVAPSIWKRIALTSF